MHPPSHNVLLQNYFPKPTPQSPRLPVRSRRAFALHCVNLRNETSKTVSGDSALLLRVVYLYTYRPCMPVSRIKISLLKLLSNPSLAGPLHGNPLFLEHVGDVLVGRPGLLLSEAHELLVIIRSIRVPVGVRVGLDDSAVITAHDILLNKVCVLESEVCHSLAVSCGSSQEATEGANEALLVAQLVVAVHGLTPLGVNHQNQPRPSALANLFDSIEGLAIRLAEGRHVVGSLFRLSCPQRHPINPRLVEPLLRTLCAHAARGAREAPQKCPCDGGASEEELHDTTRPVLVSRAQNAIPRQQKPQFLPRNPVLVRHLGCFRRRGYHLDFVARDTRTSLELLSRQGCPALLLLLLFRLHRPFRHLQRRGNPPSMRHGCLLEAPRSAGEGEGRA
mmetsp:Transcript_32999/g.83275  ORF Transcript_32999/g.83275 Transcript_32999/m.83275 type:complete len:391 (+) Transcript_32999:51-1223(+)